MPDRFPATAAQQGMVRIHRGAEVRYVWPVHAAGWLSSGWRLGEVERPSQGAAVPAVAMARAAGTVTAVAPTAQPADSDEPVSEPIDAHLPTNLLDLDLDLDLEPVDPHPAPMAAGTASAEAAEADLQETSARNDAEPASFADAGQAEVDAEEPAAPAATELPQEPTPPPAPARRGRPRKGRPEAQAEPAAQTTAKEQAPLLTSEGDDPFGLDPLL